MSAHQLVEIDGRGPVVFSKTSTAVQLSMSLLQKKIRSTYVTVQQSKS